MARSVLLIEDNPGDAHLFQVMVAGRGGGGLVCSVAETLEAGLTLATSQKFDVCMLDLSLPDSHGIATVQRLVAAVPHLPVVVLTGLDDDEVGMAAVQAGAQDFLVKGGLDAGLLRRTIRYAIERKAAALELLALAERHARILDALGEGVLEVEADGRILDCNPAAEQLLGGDRLAVVGGDLRQVGGAGVVSAISRVLESGVPLKVYNARLTSLAGVSLQADLTITAGRGAGPDPKRVAIVALRDLADRHAAFASIRHGLLLQEQMVEAVPVPMFMVDSKLRVTHSNSGFARLVDKPLDDLLGFPVADVLPQPLVDLLPPPNLGSTLAGEPADMPVQLYGRKGAYRLLRRALRDSQGQVVGFICSVSE